MRRTPRSFLLVAALAVAAVGCGDDDDAATDATTTSTTEVAETTTTSEASTTTTTEPASGDAFTLTVEDPGAEPRQELRLQLEEGDEDRVIQRQELTLRMDVGGQVEDATSPTTELDLVWRVDVVDGDQLTVSGTYDAIRVLPTPGVADAVVDQTRQVMATFEDATARTTYTRLGAILDADLDLDMADDPTGGMLEQFSTSLTDTIESLSVPFPEEAVGAGARWRVDTELVLAGLPVQVTTTVQLDEVDGEHAAGTIEQTITFVPGEVETFGVPAEIISGELTGSGPVSWDLAAGLVPRSDITTSGTVVFDVDGIRVEQQQSQRLATSAP